MFRIADAPELTTYILAAYTASPAPEAVHSELQRYLWNSAHYGQALPLADAFDKIHDGSAGSFVYHQKSGLVFTHVSGGQHQLLMAYLAAIHKTDFSKPIESWEYDQFYSWDATHKLADDFIDNGMGLFQSSVGGANSVYVGESFQWTDKERMAFAGHKKKVR